METNLGLYQKLHFLHRCFRYRFRTERHQIVDSGRSTSGVKRFLILAAITEFTHTGWPKPSVRLDGFIFSNRSLSFALRSSKCSIGWA